MTGLKRAVLVGALGAAVAAADITSACLAMWIADAPTDTNPVGAVVPAAAGIPLTGYLAILTLATGVFTALTIAAGASRRKGLRITAHILVGILLARLTVAALTITYLLPAAAGQGS